MKVERDRAALFAACDRCIGPSAPQTRTPRRLLAELAAAAEEDERSDRYDEGGPVARLEERVAALLGMEAAVFMPSGTMAQQIALRIHADRRGRRRVAFHPTCHLQLHEEKGYEELHGLTARLVGNPNELLTLADLEAVREPVAALLLELPQREIGGRLPAWEDLVAQTEWARSNGAAVHMDGARLWESGPWYARAYDEIAGLFDTVYVSFYKGLGGLAGCALAGPSDIVGEARVWQIRHGGRLPTLYPYVLAADLGLDRRLPKMEEWYRKAVEVAAALAELPGVDVVPDPPQSPLMHVFLRGDRERLEEAALDIAEERRTWLFGRLRATPIPAIQRLELNVGDGALEVPTLEIAALYGEVLERAAA